MSRFVLHVSSVSAFSISEKITPEILPSFICKKWSFSSIKFHLWYDSETWLVWIKHNRYKIVIFLFSLRLKHPISLLLQPADTHQSFKKCTKCGHVNAHMAKECTKCKNSLGPGASYRKCPNCGGLNHNACHECTSCKQGLRPDKRKQLDDFKTGVPLAKIKRHVEKRVRLLVITSCAHAVSYRNSACGFTPVWHFIHKSLPYHTHGEPYNEFIIRLID